MKFAGAVQVRPPSREARSWAVPSSGAGGTAHFAPAVRIVALEISRHCARILSDARAVASAAFTPAFLWKFRKIAPVF